MHIVIPINSKYLEAKYHISNTLVARLCEEVVPSISTRLCADRRVSALSIFADLDLSSLINISSKINLLKNSSDVTDDAPTVINRFLKSSNADDNVFSIYNPLFPFIALNNIYDANLSVESEAASSAIGSYYYLKQKTVDLETAKQHDHGIFSVINRKQFSETNSRVSQRTAIIGLSALELICLRTEADLELYNLVINSGMM